MNRRDNLAAIAKVQSLKCYHGAVMQTQPTIESIIRHFPKWTLEEADGNWCAAFVYYCCIEAGFDIPIRPKECRSCNLAGCGAWEEWALADPRISYCAGTANHFTPAAGNIVLFDRVFIGKEHDHIGIVIENKAHSIVVAEGNINNISGIIERRKDEHIRAFITIPDDFSYGKL